MMPFGKPRDIDGIVNGYSLGLGAIGERQQVDAVPYILMRRGGVGNPVLLDCVNKRISRGLSFRIRRFNENLFPCASHQAMGFAPFRGYQRQICRGFEHVDCLDKLALLYQALRLKPPYCRIAVALAPKLIGKNLK